MEIVTQNIVIDNEDINELEKLLLKNSHFDEKRLEIIKEFNSSLDINACPGSGKTTILIAKLKLIIDRLPFENGMGVCVLTHTNVAIDEIKKRLDTSGDILFKYPNYIGTIQGFIDKFLTIPFYKSRYRKDINVIDNYEYEKYLDKTLNDCGWIKDGKTWKNNKGDFVLGNNKLLDKSIHINKLNTSIELTHLQNNSYKHKETSQILLKILDDGFLTYRDAYYLANSYIDINDNIKVLFENRFKFVFIDEMQDTNIYQSNILSKLFDNDKTIVQRFGDKNQSISPVNKPEEKCGWEFKEKFIEINSSKRYGEHIARVLNYIKYNGEEVLEGNDDIKSLIPHIIVFDSDSKDLVVKKFEDLIELYKLDNTNSIFKAIGRIGAKEKSADEITIKSYNNKFIKKGTKEYHNYKNELMHTIYSNSIIEFFSIIIRIITRSLKIIDKNYSEYNIKKTLENEYYEEYIEFKSKCLKSYIKLKENDDIEVNNLKENIIYLVKRAFGEDIDVNYLEEYFNNNYINDDIAMEEVAVTNEYQNRYNIVFDTVNGVKGETHTATLYLQTRFSLSNNKDNKDLSDIDKIIDFMDGTRNINTDTNITSDIEKALNIAYVAMSRPTNLLCIAIHIDTIKDRVEKLESVGYKVVGCTDEIDNKINMNLIKAMS